MGRLASDLVEKVVMLGPESVAGLETSSNISTTLW
jgi:hypothetical protein